MTPKKNVHKLNVVDNARIQSYVSSLYDFEIGDFKAEHSEIRKDSEFWAMHMLRTPKEYETGKRILKALNFEDMEGLIEASGISWKQLLEIAGTENPEEPLVLGWANEWEKKLCELLDSSNSEFREKVLKLLKHAAPAAYKRAAEYPDMKTQNKKRLFEYSRICGPRQAATGEIMKELDLTRVYKYRNHTNDEGFITFSLSLIHTIYTSFGVSPHWLLGLGGTACVLAKNIETEQIMDYFCLLPENWQEIICKGIIKSCPSKDEAKAGKELL